MITTALPSSDDRGVGERPSATSGDGLSHRLRRAACEHYRTDGGRYSAVFLADAPGATAGNAPRELPQGQGPKKPLITVIFCNFRSSRPPGARRLAMRSLTQTTGKDSQIFRDRCTLQASPIGTRHR